MKYIYLLFLTLIISCDPGYGVLVMNKSKNNIMLVTQPAVEKRIAIKQGAFYDSIIFIKKNNPDDLELGIYELKPNKKIYLFGSIGDQPGKYLPFQSVKIIRENDTIIIDENNLLEYTTLQKRKRTYHIEIN